MKKFQNVFHKIIKIKIGIIKQFKIIKLFKVNKKKVIQIQIKTL